MPLAKKTAFRYGVKPSVRTSSIALLAALAPAAAHAASDNWTAGAGTSAWLTNTNWSAGAPPASTATVLIPTTAHNPLITSSVLLNGVGGALTINTGASLTLGTSATTGTLTMGANNITLNGTMSLFSAARGVLNLAGGSITGTGSITSTVGAINGYGTVSVPVAGATWNANVAGQSLTINGSGAYGGTFTSTSSTGSFNWNGITLGGISTSGSGGTYNLNGATINGATLGGPNGQLNVLGDSTLSGTINFNQYNTFNIGGANGAHTLNLSSATLNTVTGGAAPFIIGTGGVLNNNSGASTMGGGGTVTLQGGSITGTSSGLFKIGDPISGYGSISGNVDIMGSVTAAGTGQTLTVDGGSGAPLQLGNASGSGASMSTSGGATLDLKGNLSLIQPATANPGTGTIQFDGAHFTNAFSSSPVSINNSGLATAGTFKVTNASSFNNVAFSTGNGANLQVNATLGTTNKATINATNVTINTGGGLSLQGNSGPAELTTNNLTMANGSTLSVGSNDGVKISGNFSYQQTNPGAWVYNVTTGLGPDLTMTGNHVTLEAGSVNMGANAGAFNNNFALNSLTLTKDAYVNVVDQYVNATPSGWHSGVEALYLKDLEGVASTTPNGDIPILNLDNLYGYVAGDPYHLVDGLYTAADGTVLYIINAAPGPVPGAGLASLAFLAVAGALRRARGLLAR